MSDAADTLPALALPDAAEARAVTAYRQHLGDDPVPAVPTVPAVVPEHCTTHILATEFAPGVPIDRLAQHHQPQSLRDQAAEGLCRQAVRELFQMRLVQTDPNFGNYLFDAASGRIALLDFGAIEAIRPARVEHLRALGRALQQDVLAMIRMTGEPLRQRGVYDFGASALIGQMFAHGQALHFGTGYARTPPADLLFLQRKFAGTFVLCCRLRARVDVSALFNAPLAARPARRSKP